MACVVDAQGRLAGVVTDGDLRRHWEQIHRSTAADLMTPNPVTVGRERLAVEVLRIMEERKITSVVVVNESRVAEGVVHLHDLWRTQMF
jgi:arabinose-5-phosphate isomerase